MKHTNHTCHAEVHDRLGTSTSSEAVFDLLHKHQEGSCGGSSRSTSEELERFREVSQDSIEVLLLIVKCS